MGHARPPPYLLQPACPGRDVKQWMGHKSVQMTMRYAHLAPSDLDEGVSVLEKGRMTELADVADLKSAAA